MLISSYCGNEVLRVVHNFCPSDAWPGERYTSDIGRAMMNAAHATGAALDEWRAVAHDRRLVLAVEQLKQYFLDADRGSLQHLSGMSGVRRREGAARAAYIAAETASSLAGEVNPGDLFGRGTAEQRRLGALLDQAVVLRSLPARNRAVSNHPVAGVLLDLATAASEASAHSPDARLAATRLLNDVEGDVVSNLSAFADEKGLPSVTLPDWPKQMTCTLARTSEGHRSPASLRDRFPATIPFPDGHLRRWNTPADTEALADALLANPEAFAQHLSWAERALLAARSASDSVAARAAACETLDAAYVRRRVDGSATFASFVIATKDDAFLGAVTLLETSQHGVYEIGIHVIPSAQHRGVARKAVEALCKAAFELLRPVEIVAATSLSNAPAARALSNAGGRYGFSYEGDVDWKQLGGPLPRIDHSHVWAITRDKFVRSQKQAARQILNVTGEPNAAMTFMREEALG